MAKTYHGRMLLPGTTAERIVGLRLGSHEGSGNIISTVRVAEFAWSLFEPEEGRFCFNFFDGFLALCAEKNISVIMGTPTATPPVWLTERYPEILNANKAGALYHHGSRRHYNYNSEMYQRLCTRIVEALAKHYGQHPAIVGWQIDNELNCETNEFYSEADHGALLLISPKGKSPYKLRWLLYQCIFYPA